MKNTNRGFTLIELLVVIAIIGILSAVVLASLNTARSKGSDAAIISDIGGIRTQAQLYFNDHSNYGPVTTTITGDCSAASANLFSDATVLNQTGAADTANGAGSVVCNVSLDGSAYAVSAALVATPGTFYCVDSAGAGKTASTTLGVATSC